ncbi:hypothetical protein [Williamsia sp. DF01-3]|nr:hypothetical protein [Williamsia sp. DF01-3]
MTIDANGSETIKGSLTYALSAQYKYVKIRVNAGGTSWLVVASN